MLMCRYVKGVKNIPPVFILHHFVDFVKSFYRIMNKSYNFSYEYYYGH